MNMKLFFRSIVLGVCLLVIGMADAEAGKGVLVRMEVRGEDVDGAITVSLEGANGGQSQKIVLKDDGVPPDVSAEDGSLTGAALVEDDAFNAKVEINGQTYDGGEVSWSSSEEYRDLVIVYDGDTLSVQAASSSGGAEGSPSSGGAEAASGPPQAGGQDGSGAQGQPSSQGGGFGGQPGPGGPGGAGVSSDSQSGLLFLLLGGGLLGLVGVAWFWSRAGSALSSRQIGLAAQSIPSHFGAELPSISEGLVICVVDESDSEALVVDLLRTLTRDYTVIVGCPSNMPLPIASGGKVYRSPGWRPHHFVESLDDLLDATDEPVAALLLSPTADGSMASDLAELMSPLVHAIVVTHDAVNCDLAQVGCERIEGGWLFRYNEEERRIPVGSHGLEPPWYCPVPEDEEEWGDDDPEELDSFAVEDGEEDADEASDDPEGVIGDEVADDATDMVAQDDGNTVWGEPESAVVGGDESPLDADVDADDGDEQAKDA